jgi:putative intracellular protease/amidase
VAAFSDEEEELLGLLVALPATTEALVDAAGAICVPAEPWKPHVVVDGRLVTGQNPQSSSETALRMLDVLRSLGEGFNAPLNINKPWGK